MDLLWAKTDERELAISDSANSKRRPHEPWKTYLSKWYCCRQHCNNYCIQAASLASAAKFEMDPAGAQGARPSAELSADCLDGPSDDQTRKAEPFCKKTWTTAQLYSILLSFQDFQWSTDHRASKITKNQQIELRQELQTKFASVFERTLSPIAISKAHLCYTA